MGRWDRDLSRRRSDNILALPMDCRNPSMRKNIASMDLGGNCRLSALKKSMRCNRLRQDLIPMSTSNSYVFHPDLCVLRLTSWKIRSIQSHILPPKRVGRQMNRNWMHLAAVTRGI